MKSAAHGTAAGLQGDCQYRVRDSSTEFYNHHHHHHHHHHTYVARSWTSFICILQIRASIWGAFFFLFYLVFLLFTKPGERRLLHWGFWLAGPNRYCNPTTVLLIIIIILILILSILIILIIPIILIILIIFILIILFVLIIVVINSFLLPSLSSSSVSFIVLVSNLINIKRMALFVTCSRLWLAATPKKPRETLAAFRLHAAVPLIRLRPYPSPASFRTSPLASSANLWMLMKRWGSAGFLVILGQANRAKEPGPWPDSSGLCLFLKLQGFMASWLHGLMVRSLPRPRCYMCRLRIDPSGTFAERPRLCACCEVLSAQKRQQAAFITLITWIFKTCFLIFLQHFFHIFLFCSRRERISTANFHQEKQLGPMFSR